MSAWRKAYDMLLAGLLRERTEHGDLSQEAETAWAAGLDECWRNMTTDEHQALDDWWRKRS